MFFSVIHKANSIKYTIFGIPVWKIKKSTKGSYGMKTILMDYTGVDFDDKKIRIQHGWTPLDGAIPNDLRKQDADVIFAWNNRYKRDWDNNSKIPCYILGAPFVLYRKMHKIEKDNGAKGTIAFPSHNSRKVETKFDIDKYCNELRELPEEFQPVTVCLHMLDIDLYHLDKEYEKRGFKTVCAGMDHKRLFYEVFYDILRKHKYATSNEPGTYTFYAVEMGIPFFIQGELPFVDNCGGRDKNLESNIIKITDYEYGKLAYDLFSNKDRHVITEEQKKFVDSELGVKDCIGKDELIDILRKL